MSNVTVKTMLSEVRDDVEYDGTTLVLAIDTIKLKRGREPVKSEDFTECLLDGKSLELHQLRVWLAKSPEEEQPSLGDVSNLIYWKNCAF